MATIYSSSTAIFSRYSLPVVYKKLLLVTFIEGPGRTHVLLALRVFDHASLSRGAGAKHEREGELVALFEEQLAAVTARNLFRRKCSVQLTPDFCIFWR